MKVEVLNVYWKKKVGAPLYFKFLLCFIGNIRIEKQYQSETPKETYG